MVDYEHIAYTPTNAARVAEVSRPTLYRWMKLDGFPVAALAAAPEFRRRHSSSGSISKRG